MFLQWLPDFRCKFFAVAPSHFPFDREKKDAGASSLNQLKVGVGRACAPLHRAVHIDCGKFLVTAGELSALDDVGMVSVMTPVNPDAHFKGSFGA
jgi:hypothetical protein